METKFPTLLSPLVIGKYVVKNRMESANAIPHFLQSAETYPAPDTITYYEDLADCQEQYCHPECRQPAQPFARRSA